MRSVHLYPALGIAVYTYLLLLKRVALSVPTTLYIYIRRQWYTTIHHLPYYMTAVYIYGMPVCNIYG